MTNDELEVGRSFRVVLVDELTRTQIVQYAGASGDYNPLHTDERYATEVGGYPSVFAHGMLTAGMTGEAICQVIGDGEVRSFGGRFVAQVWPGDTLTAEVKVLSNVPTDAEATTVDNGTSSRSVIQLSVVTLNQHDQPVFTGSAEAIIRA